MSKKELLIYPEGSILNDSADGVDHLNYSVYASAIAQRIDEANPPITIGIFSRWGGGKSHLLKHIRDKLEKKQRQNSIKFSRTSCDCFKSWRSRCACRLLFMFLFVSLFSTACLWTISPRIFVTRTLHTTPQNNTIPSNATMQATTVPMAEAARSSRYIALGVLFVCITVICIISCCNESFYSARFRLILYATFTKLPIRPRKSAIVKEYNYDVTDIRLDESLKRQNENENHRYIFVHFNAWEYAGSDTLWAGIVTNLSKSIEAEFGVVTSRLFRLLSVHDMDIGEIKEENDNKVYVHLPNMENDSPKFVEIMKEYGVVKKWGPWKEDSRVGKGNWWMVEYSHHKEAQNACDSISLKGMDARMTKPCRACEAINGDILGRDDVINGVGTQSPAINKKGTQKAMLLNKKVQHSHENSAKQTRFALMRHFLRHFIRHPKTTCGLPNLFWWILFYASLVAILGVTAKIADIFEWDVYRNGRAVPVIVQLIAWVPPVVAVLYVLLNFLWAMSHSQRQRIQSALKGTEGNVAAQLGFMNKVKTEVKLMTQLVKCAEFTHRRRYRVVIFIDDLDRVDHTKVKSVLEAVSILLSDHSSRFVCLIAVDSRVAVKCVEDSMSASLVKSKVNGNEYLKKIINLPFCLPEVSTDIKKRYICGLLSLSDETKKMIVEERLDENISTLINYDVMDGLFAKGVMQETTLNDNLEGIRYTNGVVKTARQSNQRREINFFPMNAGDLLTNNNKDEDMELLSHSQFAVACRKHFYTDELLQRYLDGNLRNIKRIFNVLSLTLWVIHYHEKERSKEMFLRRNSTDRLQGGRINSATGSNGDDDYPLFRRTEQLARDLVTWIVLTDQWPYRMSYLLQVIDDKSKPVDNKTMLFDVYTECVLPEFESLEEEESLQSLDVSQKILQKFLAELKDDPNTELNARKAKYLKKISINLDQSLKQTIQYERAKVTRCTSTNKLDETISQCGSSR